MLRRGQKASENKAPRPRILFWKKEVDVTRLNRWNSGSSKKVLSSLLQGEPDQPKEHLFPALDAEGQPKEYLVQVSKPGQAKKTYRRVYLKQSYAEYPSEKHPDVRHFATHEPKFFDFGGESQVYLSDAKVKLAPKGDGDFEVTYKKQKPESKRVVKEFNIVKDAKGQVYDTRPLGAKAEREYSFLRQMSFGAKKPAVSADQQHAALVMPYVAGKSLFELLGEDEGYDKSGVYVGGGNIFTLEQRLTLTGLIAEAILNMHDRGIIHGDIKPDNFIVLLDQDGNPIAVTAVDFGHANVISEQDPKKILSGGGSFDDRVDYRAQEVIARRRRDVKSDAFSLAVMLEADIWQNLENPKHHALSTSQKDRIKDILKQGVVENQQGRASVDDIRKVFSDIKQELKSGPQSRFNIA